MGKIRDRKIQQKRSDESLKSKTKPGTRPVSASEK